MVNSKTVKKMKTRNFIVFIAAGVAVMASFGSCTKEFDKVDVPENEIRTVVTAGLDAATKTYMGAAEEGKRKVYWENGDAISINGVSSAALAGVGADAATANFNFEGALETPYMAVYPATIWKGFDEVETQKYLVTLPREQVSSHTAKASFAQNALPMAAYSAEGGNLQFKHLCAVVKLSLTGDKEISYVEFRGNNEEKVSGDFILFDDPENKPLALTFVGASAADKVVRVNVGKTLSGTATDIYVTVPVAKKSGTDASAGEFSQGFTFRVVDSENHFMEIGTSKSRSLTAGLVANMEAVAYEPGAPIDVVNIGTAEQLVDFAKKYNSDNYYTSVGKDLKVNLTNDIVFDETTSAAFVSIGQKIGFLGTFDGKGFSIKNYTGSKPIFAYVAASGKPTEGTLKNLTLDESCVFTVSTATSFAPMVISNFGTITNCHSNAIVNVSGNLTEELNVGGLVDRNRSTESVIEGCSFGGVIAFDKTFVSSGVVRVGGIVARNYNEVSTLIKNTKFKGSINYTDLTGTANVYIAGIAADWQGSLEGCETTVEGTITTSRSAKAANVWVGGIAAKISGKGSVKDCHNKGNLNLSDGNAGRGTAYMIGGVVAESTTGCAVADSGNEGTLTMDLYRDTGHIGGVIGKNSGIIKKCENSGKIEISGVLTGNTSGIGGVCGYNASADIDNMTNKGNFKKNGNFFAGANIQYHIGGVIGRNTVAINGTPTMTNAGSIDLSECHTSIFNVGGIIGYADVLSTYTNCTHTGLIEKGTSGTWNTGNIVGNPSAN